MYGMSGQEQEHCNSSLQSLRLVRNVRKQPNGLSVLPRPDPAENPRGAADVTESEFEVECRMEHDERLEKKSIYFSDRQKQ